MASTTTDPLSRPSAPRRVGIFLPSFSGGGAERAMLNLARGLAARAWAVDLVLAVAGGPLASEVPDGVDVIELGGSRTSSALPALARYLRRTPVRGLIAADTHTNVAAILAGRLSGARRRIVVVQQVQLSTHSAGGATRRERLMPLAARHAYPLADVRAAVSQGVADDLVRTCGLDPASVVVQYNPIPLERVTLAAGQPLEDPWDGRRPERVVIASGRFTEAKGFDVLIDAMAALHAERDVGLIILGDGHLRPALQEQVTRAGLDGAVLMPGFDVNPFRWMAAADVFVLSSRWEGLPTVLIEAMALGLPVVATDCPSGPYEILKAGELGPLVAVDDVEALAAAVGERLDAGAPTYDLREYDVASVAEGYEQLLLS